MFEVLQHNISFASPFSPYQHYLSGVRSVAISVANVPPLTGIWRNTLQKPTTTTPASSAKRDLRSWTVLNSTNWKATQTSRWSEVCWHVQKKYRMAQKGPVEDFTLFFPLKSRMKLWRQKTVDIDISSSCEGHSLCQSSELKFFVGALLWQLYQRAQTVKVQCPEFCNTVFKAWSIHLDLLRETRRWNEKMEKH